MHAELSESQAPAGEGLKSPRQAAQGSRRNWNRALCALVLAAATLCALGRATPVAFADSNCYSTDYGSYSTPSPTVVGGEIVMAVEIDSGGQNYCPGDANGSGISYPPPACWWAPMFTPVQLESFAYEYYQRDNDPYWTELLNYYGSTTTPAGYTSDSGPPYSNWNIGSSPDGMWWSMVFNMAEFDSPQFGNCLSESIVDGDKPWTWADNDNQPANVTGPVFSEEQLAEFAADSMILPTQDFDTSPVGNVQTIDVPVWTWIPDVADDTQVLKLCWAPGGDAYCSVVTAVPTAIQVIPDLNQPYSVAKVYGNGTAACAVNGSGSVGSAYYPPPTQNPPCGVTYSQSSVIDGQPTLFNLSIEVTWQISWNLGGGGEWPMYKQLPGATHAITVQEIQNLGGNGIQ